MGNFKRSGSDYEYLDKNACTPDLVKGCKGFGSAEKNTDRLHRALEAAEEEMEAALRRNSAVTQLNLKRKDLEIQELQRTIEVKEGALERLRDTLTSTKRAADAKLTQAESLLAEKIAEVTNLQAEVLSLQGERDSLESRLQSVSTDLRESQEQCRELQSQVNCSARTRAEEASRNTTALQRERKEKELLRLEVSELKKELDALSDQYRETKAGRQVAREELRTTREEVEVLRKSEDALNQQLTLEREQSAQLILKKDGEISELRDKLQSERSIRKACEKWLKAELKSREELEALLKAFHDVSIGKLAEQEMQKVEEVLENLRQTAEPEEGGQFLIPATRSPCRSRRAGTTESQRVQAELTAAKKLICERLLSAS